MASYGTWRVLLHARVPSYRHTNVLWQLYRVDDDGTITGIFKTDLDASISVLGELCQTIGAIMASVEKRRVSRMPELYAAEVCVKSTAARPLSTIRRMVKIAMVGPSDVGKSTLVGVLSTGQLDNGSGSMRLGTLRHRHELISGRTSSLAVEVLPFDGETKQPIRYEYDSMEPISLARQKQLLGTARVAQFIDLPGDNRFQKITYSALTSWAAPDWICLVVSACSVGKKNEMTTIADLLTLVLGLELPFFVAINKIDLVSSATSLGMVTELQDLMVKLRKELFGQTVPPYAVSIMRISCVTGEGIENLTKSIFRLHQRHNLRMINYLLAEDRFANCSALFCVEGIQIVPDVGLVLLGTVASGTAEIATCSLKAMLGPTTDGSFIPIKVHSAHRMRLPVHTISAGQLVTLAVEGVAEEHVHRGMLLLIAKDELQSVNLPMINRIEADVVGVDDAAVEAFTEPISGVLYCMGTRWNAKLVRIQSLYLDVRRVFFELAEGAKISPFPGTRVIFLSSVLRIQGLVNNVGCHGTH